MNPYKCDHHKIYPNELCVHCYRALQARHDKLLEYVREVANRSYQWCDDLYVDHARDLLKELDLPENKDSE